MKITIFSEELRECLNAAGLSDCGENDTWNYWYQRLMNAYNESVERQIMTEQAENAKLRELAGALLTSHEKMCTQRGHCFGCTFFYEEVKACPYVKISRTLRELGIEVDG